MSTKRFNHVFVHGATSRLSRDTLLYAQTVLAFERAPYDSALDIYYVPPEEMKAINRQSRNMDKVTDVLTFTEQSAESAAMSHLLFAGDRKLSDDEEDARAFAAATSLARRTEAVDCGSVFICLEYMHARCLAAPHKNLPFLEYLKVALVHAVLHATGYQHETRDELRLMSKREQFMLSRIDALERRFPQVYHKIDGFELLKQKCQTDLSRNQRGNLYIFS